MAWTYQQTRQGYQGVIYTYSDNPNNGGQVLDPIGKLSLFTVTDDRPTSPTSGFGDQGTTTSVHTVRTVTGMLTGYMLVNDRQGGGGFPISLEGAVLPDGTFNPETTLFIKLVFAPGDGVNQGEQSVGPFRIRLKGRTFNAPYDNNIGITGTFESVGPVVQTGL